jgi:pyruvate dehydrogenase E1 component beta subunit/2-oxoisovalerate dehydrogenase E1 component
VPHLPLSKFDAQIYRDKAEVEEWRKRGPIARFSGWLLDNRLIHAEEMTAIDTAVDAEIAAAVAFAEDGPWEAVADLIRHVMAEARPSPPAPAAPAAEAVETTYREAVKQAIREAMIRDPSVFLMGEDVGACGGCYAATKGLLAEFGPDRIRDTTLSESAFTGAWIGAAAAMARSKREIPHY